MVVNILKPSTSLEKVLEYNDGKVERNVATVLSVHNIPGSSKEDIEKTFARYERRNIKTKNISFHMNIDPLIGQDNMSDDDIIRFAGMMMERLGYKDQPYVIYRHNDIGRQHYHVVSIRTDKRGRKIKDNYEGKECFKYLTLYQSMFDYKVGNGNMKKKEIPVIVFDPKFSEVSSQMKSIYDLCLKYDFTSVTQFIMILRKHHIRASLRHGTVDEFVLLGLDARMQPCTRLLTEEQLGLNLYKMYLERALECGPRMHVMKTERQRIAGCAKGPLKDATSELHFRNMMRRNSIDVMISRDPETKKITGASFVDHQTKCAFRLSDFGESLSLEKLQEADERWPHKSPTRHSRATNLAGELLLGLVSGDGSRSKGHDQKDETDLEQEIRLEQQSL